MRTTKIPLYTLALLVVTACSAGSNTRPVAASAVQLENSTWYAAPYVIQFLAREKVLVSGGDVAGIAPDGAEGTYSLRDGKVHVKVMDESRDGEFDGSSLTFDGRPAVRLESAIKDGHVEGTVLIASQYGNLMTTILQRDITALGWKIGDTLTVQVGDKTFDTALVNDYKDVAEGAYLAQTVENGLLELAIRWRAEEKLSLAKESDASVGAKVTVSRKG